MHHGVARLDRGQALESTVAVGLVTGRIAAITPIGDPTAVTLFSSSAQSTPTATPAAAADAARRAVIVWLHGGGYSSGAGSLDWYDGTRLAHEGDVVVVGVNYRLGPLGYLYCDGMSDGQMACRT